MIKSFFYIFLILSLISCGGGSSSKKNKVIDQFDFIVTVEKSNLEINKQDDFFNDISDLLASSFNDAFSLIKKDIHLIFKDCNDISPFYDPQTSEVVMCYEFLAEIMKHYDEITSLGIFETVMYHEIGHAFVDQFDLPILGQEEDIADAIAVIYKLNIDNENEEEVKDDVVDIVLTGDFLNTVAPADYLAEHTVGPQRLGNLICWAFGAIDQVIEDEEINLVIDEFIENNRDCTSEYIEKRESLMELIGEYTKINIFI